MDDLVPQGLGADSLELLQRLGYTVEWKTYPMAHAVCPDEIADIRTWLQQVFEI